MLSDYLLPVETCYSVNVARQAAVQTLSGPWNSYSKV